MRVETPPSKRPKSALNLRSSVFIGGHSYPIRVEGESGRLERAAAGAGVPYRGGGLSIVGGTDLGRHPPVACRPARLRRTGRSPLVPAEAPSRRVPRVCPGSAWPPRHAGRAAGTEPLTRSIPPRRTGRQGVSPVRLEAGGWRALRLGERSGTHHPDGVPAGIPSRRANAANGTAGRSHETRTAVDRPCRRGQSRRCRPAATRPRAAGALPRDRPGRQRLRPPGRGRHLRMRFRTRNGEPKRRIRPLRRAVFSLFRGVAEVPPQGPGNVKLPFDQNLSHRLVSALADVFPDSKHVRNVGLGRADDDAVWQYALAQGFAIVYKDSDFHQLSFVRGHPPKVVWIRRGNCSTDEIEALVRWLRVAQGRRSRANRWLSGTCCCAPTPLVGFREAAHWVSGFAGPQLSCRTRRDGRLLPCDANFYRGVRVTLFGELLERTVLTPNMPPQPSRAAGPTCQREGRACGPRR